jgi:serine phosphatase RsbU (regulator of sigma subunit)/catechol 2,3-dioxygenase-like lactoylglutathione lyase family enzyme
MSDTNSSLWRVQPDLRLDRKSPYLRLLTVTLFVRDQNRSLEFYVGRLGFSLMADYSLPTGARWVAVAPPDGTAMLALITPKPEDEEYRQIGQARQVIFLTEDVQGKYREWVERGLEFLQPPRQPPWGGVFATFADPDGNVLTIMGFDHATRLIEEQRRQLAEKLEAERRAAWELEIARQVQARLFPHKLPPAKTLEYAGACIQARQVGGDYYDVLDLGRGRLGLIIADIAGKGIAAALLMANLQANLRSQCAIASDRPEQFLKSINQVFFENTADGDYATFFFGEYDDETRRLRYANCGHLPALLLRNDHRLEQLDSTSTVLGLFEEWDCAIKERQLSPGDILALYSDGISEAANGTGEEFGTQRLGEALRRHHQLECQALLAAVVEEVRGFGANEQQDDITLVVARCRET